MEGEKKPVPFQRTEFNERRGSGTAAEPAGHSRPPPGSQRKGDALLGNCAAARTCLHCEEEIKPKRLDTVPWTKFCIRCQEAADRHEFETEAGEAIDEFLADAA